MEVSAAQIGDFVKNYYDGRTFEEIIPYSSPQVSQNPSRISLLERRKPQDKDALQAVKLDPAVLEAQVTVTNAKGVEELPPHQENSVELVAKRNVKDQLTDARSYPSFEEVMSSQQAALLGLSPQQLELLMAFVDTLRRQRLHTQKYLECAFCKNNGEPVAWYSSHALRDRRRVRCPVLRALRCPRCGATGDRAHTEKYCPLNIFLDYWSCP